MKPLSSLPSLVNFKLSISFVQVSETDKTGLVIIRDISPVDGWVYSDIYSHYGVQLNGEVLDSVKERRIADLGRKISAVLREYAEVTSKTDTTSERKNNQ